MAILPITNVVNITIETVPQGLTEPNVNNLLLLTTESPTNLETYGDYLSATQVADNYGTNSVTAAMANAIFAQVPNPLSGGGQIVIAHTTGVSATSGDFATADISANLAALIAVTNGDLKVTVDSVAQNLTGLNFSQQTTLKGIASVLQAALINCTVTASATAITITSNTVGASSTVALASYSGGGTDLTGAGLLNTASGTATGGADSSGETVLEAVDRILPLAFFAGVITNLNLEDAAIETAATGIQALDMMFLHHAGSTADIAGIGTTIQQATENKTRILPYFTGGQAVANLYKSAYAGRLFSVDFTGSNTSSTMNLKSLSTITPDAGVTQTLYEAANTAGTDLYVSYQGVPAVYSTEGNEYADVPYSLLALKFALETAGFNYLAQTNTKIPQTEPGMNGLKAAYIGVIKQFVANGVIAPGSWNSADTFGDPQTFKNNITQNGYYVYSSPVADQSSSDRNARKAPLVQIAVKLAGAIQSSNVLVFVNQ